MTWILVSRVCLAILTWMIAAGAALAVVHFARKRDRLLSAISVGVLMAYLSVACLVMDALGAA